MTVLRIPETCAGTKENMEDRQMLDKKTLTFRVIAGLALLYVGGNLIFSSVKEQPRSITSSMRWPELHLHFLAWPGADWR